MALRQMPEWPIQAVIPMQYVCGFCDKNVGGDRGWQTIDQEGQPNDRIYVCPVCFSPSYFAINENPQVPGLKYGEQVENTAGRSRAALRRGARHGRLVVFTCSHGMSQDSGSTSRLKSERRQTSRLLTTWTISPTLVMCPPMGRVG